MTDVQISQAIALGRCTFSPGSTAKRFVAQMAGYALKRPTYEMSDKASAFLDRLAHQYRKQLGRCMSVACMACSPTIDRDEILIAVDAVTDGRHDFDDRLLSWKRAALALYNTTHGTTFAHPYEYATTCAPQSRRAHTLGDVYCRFCGERLLQQVKQPHKLVAESPDAHRHLTICALQLLGRMRAPAKPGHRALPMEMMWG